MAQTQDPNANPLLHPEQNTPGTRVDMKANDLYPNAVEQEYHEPGGTRKKGEKRKTDYDGPPAGPNP